MPERRGRQRGFSLVELLITLAVVGILAAIAIPIYRVALLRSHSRAAVADARTLHTGFKRFYVDHNGYPNASSAPSFDLTTFDPLSNSGYYDGGLVQRLEGDTADAYDSPNDMGANQEFWLEMSLDIDPTIRVLVADSNDAPLASGQWMDGVYLYQEGVLQKM